MMKILAVGILLTFLSGCSWHVNRYGEHFENVDVRIGGHWNHPKAEHDAREFEKRWNKQFDSNVKMPRFPFKAGRYVDSLVDRDGMKIISMEGKFY